MENQRAFSSISLSYKNKQRVYRLLKQVQNVMCARGKWGELKLNDERFIITERWQEMHMAFLIKTSFIGFDNRYLEIERWRLREKIVYAILTFYIYKHRVCTLHTNRTHIGSKSINHRAPLPNIFKFFQLLVCMPRRLFRVFLFLFLIFFRPKNTKTRISSARRSL